MWPQSEFPLIPVGRLVLDRNPLDYFAEVEQIAFSPAHLVPGIEPSPDKMLQGRLFSYTDTHRHRLGTNYLHLPVNCPYRARTLHYQVAPPPQYENTLKVQESSVESDSVTVESGYIIHGYIIQPLILAVFGRNWIFK